MPACSVHTPAYEQASWTLQASHGMVINLQAIEMKHFLQVAGVTWMDWVCNEDMRKGLGQEAELAMVVGKLFQNDQQKVHEVEGKCGQEADLVYVVVKYMACMSCSLAVSKLLCPVDLVPYLTVSVC